MNRLRVIRDLVEHRVTDEELRAANPRPSTRGDCEPGGSNAPELRVNGCPWVCKWNMSYSVVGREVVEHHQPGEPGFGACALDVAERGGADCEEVGHILGITRGAIRQIEMKAFNRVAHPSRAKRLRDFLPERESSVRIQPEPDDFLSMRRFRRDVADRLEAEDEARAGRVSSVSSVARTTQERKARLRRENAARRKTLQRDWLSSPSAERDSFDD